MAEDSLARMFKSRSANVLHDLKPKNYPTDALQYELQEECGAGVSRFQPLSMIKE